jgi:predicted HAD superfamily phosphohydrolase
MEQIAEHGVAAFAAAHGVSHYKVRKLIKKLQLVSSSQNNLRKLKEHIGHVAASTTVPHQYHADTQFESGA